MVIGKYAIPVRGPGIASCNDTATTFPVQPPCAAGLLLRRIVTVFPLLHHGLEESESHALVERGEEFDALKAAEWRFVLMRQTQHAARRMSGEPFFVRLSTVSFIFSLCSFLLNK